MKNPYTYPHKTRKAMIGYLAAHDSYGGWNHPYRKWSPLAWNVKIGNVSMDGKRGEHQANPAYDEAWQEHCRTNESLWSVVIEDMARQYNDGEYTTYPGDDQGSWQFTFAGRSGGHMLLSSWSNHANMLTDFDNENDWQQWLDGLNYDTLKTLYRAIRCMDADFAHEQINREFEYQLNFHRGQWEEEHARELVFADAESGLQPCPAI